MAGSGVVHERDLLGVSDRMEVCGVTNLRDAVLSEILDHYLEIAHGAEPREKLLRDMAKAVRRDLAPSAYSGMKIGGPVAQFSAERLAEIVGSRDAAHVRDGAP